MLSASLRELHDLRGEIKMRSLFLFCTQVAPAEAGAIMISRR
jgi:hypothetical protein